MSALGKLVASVVLDTAEFTGGTEKAEYQAAKMASRVDRTMADLESKAKRSMAGVGAALAAGFGIAALKDWIEETVRANAALDDMAEKTGGSVEALSGLVNVAKVGGHDVSQLEGAMAKLAKGMVNADEETNGAGKALAFLGISATDANGKLKSSADLLPEIAKAFDQYQDGAGKAAIAQTLLSKSGAELLPYLKDLAEGTDNVAKVTAAQAAQAEALEKNIRRLAIAKGDLARTIAQEAIPVLNTVAEMYLKTKTAADGTLASTQRLAADNTLRDWFETIAYGAAFAVDSFKSLITVTQAVGQVIAGTARMAPALVELTTALAQGNGTAAAMAWERIKFIQTQTNEELARMIGNHKSIRFELEERLKLARLVQQAEAGAYADQNDRRAGGSKRPTLEWRGDGGGADKAVKIKSDLADIDKLLASIDNKAAGFDSDFSEKMTKLWMAFATGRISVEQYTLAQGKLLAQQPGVKKGAEEEAKALEYLAKWYQNLHQAQLAEIDARDAALDGLEDGNARLKTEIKTLGMTTAERDKYLVGLEEEAALKAALSGKDEDYIRKLANERRALIDRKANLEDQARLWGQLSDRAGAFFSDLAMNGRSAFDRLRDSLKSFAAELIALMAKKWILNLAGNFIGGSTGQMLLSAAGTAGQGTMAGMLGGAASMAGPIALAIAVNSVVGPALARAMGAGERGQKVAQTASILGGSLFGAVIGKFTDPNGLAQRTGWFGDSTLGGDTRTRASSAFGGFGITKSQWFGDDMIAKLNEFFQGLAQMDNTFASFLSSAEVERVKVALAGKDKSYGFGTEHGDFSGALGQITVDRINAIFDAVDPSLKKWIEGFSGSGSELATFAAQLLEVRQALNGNTIAGLDITTLKAMQASGEGLSDTLSRVIGQWAAIQSVAGNEIDTLKAYDKALKGAFDVLGIAVPDSIEAWRTLAGSIDLSTEAGRKLFETMAQSAGTWQQVQAAVSNAIAGIWASAQSVLGGGFGATFAKAKLQTTYAQWQAMRGENFTFEEMLQHFQSFTPDTLAQGIENTRNQYGSAGVALLNQLWADYVGYQQALGASTNGLNTAFTDVTTTANGLGDALAAAKGSLVQYLNGLNQSSLSPFGAKDRYNMASSVFWQQLGLAESGDLTALQNIQGYHQQFLQASQGYNASNPAYVADYMSSYQRLNALTGNQAIQPLTVAAYQAAMAVQTDLLQRMGVKLDAQQSALVVIANAVAADEGLAVRAPELAAAVERLALAVETPGSL